MIHRFSRGDKIPPQMFKHQFFIALTLGFVVFLFGVAGYSLIEGWKPFDALYMTVITLATIGYQEVNTLSTAGRVFTIVLIFVGIGVVAFILDSGVKMIFEGDFQ